MMGGYTEDLKKKQNCHWGVGACPGQYGSIILLLSSIQYGWTALEGASFGGYETVVEILLGAGAYADLQDKVTEQYYALRNLVKPESCGDVFFIYLCTLPIW